MRVVAELLLFLRTCFLRQKLGPPRPADCRHDTILYAKQSYTPGTASVPPPPDKGYVEPMPTQRIELNLCIKDGPVMHFDSGIVLAGPRGPVVTPDSGDDCADKPLVATIVVRENDTGRELTRFTSLRFAAVPIRGESSTIPSRTNTAWHSSTGTPGELAGHAEVHIRLHSAI